MNEKACFILWFWRTSGTVSPSLFEPHKLNHVSVFLVTLRLSCLPLGQPVPAYPSHHHLPCTVIGLSTYGILSFFFHSTVAPIISFLSARIFFPPNCFVTFIPLIWVLSPTFHFSVSSTTLFTFLISFSQLASLPASLFRVLPLPSRTPREGCRVSWTECWVAECALVLSWTEPVPPPPLCSVHSPTWSCLAFTSRPTMHPPPVVTRPPPNSRFATPPLTLTLTEDGPTTLPHTVLVTLIATCVNTASPLPHTTFPLITTTVSSSPVSRFSHPS